MVKYECFRCGYVNKIKSNFIKHLNRKFTCKPKIKDISIEEINKYYFNCLKKKCNQNEPKPSQNEPKPNQNEPKPSQNEHSAYKKINNFNTINNICFFCKKQYIHKQSLNRHLKKGCKKQIIQDEYLNLKKLVDLLNKKLEFNKKIIDEKLKIQKKELKKEFYK
jgi:hypothetical protein